MSVAIIGLVHLWMALARLVLGEAWRRDQVGFDDGALPHRDALRAKVGFDGLTNLGPRLVLLHQVADGEDRRLIGDTLSDQLDASKSAHSGNLDQNLFHGWAMSEYHWCCQ